jgi:hypothetical protein
LALLKKGGDYFNLMRISYRLPNQLAKMNASMNGKMADYMMLWIRIDNEQIARVTDKTNPVGDTARSYPEGPKNPLIFPFAIRSGYPSGRAADGP